jgi:excisionase family DNA binding protein
MQRLTISAPEAARLAGVSTASIYDAVRRGEIPARRLGRRVLITRLAFELWLEGHSQAKTADNFSTPQEQCP